MADPEDIRKYSEELSLKPYWSGSYSEALADEELSEPDRPMTVRYYEPYSEKNRNHGTLGYVVIANSDIYFSYESR